jgi:hypothetical protein
MSLIFDPYTRADEQVEYRSNDSDRYDESLLDEPLDAAYLTGPFGVDPWITVHDGDGVRYETSWYRPYGYENGRCIECGATNG